MGYIRKYRKLAGVVSLAWLAIFHHAQAHDQCSTIVSSAQEAAARAEWVIEADIRQVAHVDAGEQGLLVIVEDVKLLREVGKSPRYITASLRPACLADAVQRLRGKAAELAGKRMRFYGTKMMDGRGRQFFYMEPAGQPLPVFAERKTYATAAHAVNDARAGADGWYRAHSTEGGFSIDMPGKFEDATRAAGAASGEPAFMLRGKDQYGSVYLAVFERAGPESTTGRAVDQSYTKPDASTRMFKGAEAVRTVGKVGERITHGLWFRIPGGSFMLGIVTEKEHEAASLKFQERFFNSLAFD